MRLPLALFTLCFGVYACADDVLQQADALLSRQQAAAALQLLSPLEDERAGDPAYDYLLGLAYLEHQEPTLAVFAFERCLAAAPDNGPCRVQMARTHLAMGETSNARTELQTIQSYNPPPAVQALVSQYLGAIARQSDASKRQTKGFIQLGLGFDSNSNSATEQNRIALPAFNNTVWTIPSSSQKQDSSVLQGVLSGTYLYKISPAVTAIAEAGSQFHSYQDNNDYSYQTVDAAGGAALQQGMNQWIGKLQLQKMWLGGDSYRDVVGVLGQYQRQVSPATQFAAYLQASDLSYDQTGNRDARRTTAGLACSLSLAQAYSPVLYGSVYSGQERTKEAAFDAFSQDFSGIRAGGNMTLSPKLQFNSALSLEQRQFKDNYPLFSAARDETEYNLNLGLIWRLSADTAIQPSYSFITNNSNIALTDYQRHIVAIDVRFDL